MEGIIFFNTTNTTRIINRKFRAANDMNKFVFDLQRFATTWTLTQENGKFKLGETEYDTLTDALSAVNDGDTVQLGGAVTTSAVAVISKNLTIDLNGNTLTASGSPALRTTAASFTL